RGEPLHRRAVRQVCRAPFGGPRTQERTDNMPRLRWGTGGGAPQERVKQRVGDSREETSRVVPDPAAPALLERYLGDDVGRDVEEPSRPAHEPGHVPQRVGELHGALPVEAEKVAPGRQFLPDIIPEADPPEEGHR